MIVTNSKLHLHYHPTPSAPGGSPFDARWEVELNGRAIASVERRGRSYYVRSPLSSPNTAEVAVETWAGVEDRIADSILARVFGTKSQKS